MSEIGYSMGAAMRGETRIPKEAYKDTGLLQSPLIMWFAMGKLSEEFHDMIMATGGSPRMLDGSAWHIRFMGIEEDRIYTYLE